MIPFLILLTKVVNYAQPKLNISDILDLNYCPKIPFTIHFVLDVVETRSNVVVGRLARQAKHGRYSLFPNYRLDKSEIFDSVRRPVRRIVGRSSLTLGRRAFTGNDGQALAHVP